MAPSGQHGLMVLAHQGGWDEAALVIGPLALLFLALWLANRRAARALAQRDDATETPRADGVPDDD